MLYAFAPKICSILSLISAVHPSAPNPIALSGKNKINVNKYGCIEINEETMQTSDEKIFAGGDIIGTKATVAYAARNGREAAKKIDEFLQKM